MVRAMAIPVELPELGLGPRGEAVQVSGWLVEIGDRVERGDRIVEVLVPGVTFDVVAPVGGRIDRIAVRVDETVPPGGVLAWIDPDEESATDTSHVEGGR